ncbi:hypothetical protein JGH11_18765 [Dysgonomonas sp. Marseille-P4677]|uniref:hypothetical protein n=1 Tax=Dysgonomonas sp. Marseille-P4677 TaxID=2364790 RepID=UPI0019140BCE|nr:hypothetical protein [Dysgonomonas sp. Marseille-P4677]MBK5722916.1 hypothetical protein [Dysgonomonas sp. Marseille-P4677]
MNKYNCYVLFIKERKYKDKTKYELINYEVYPNINKELACYFAVKKSGNLSGFTNNKPCHPMKGEQVIGFYKWGNDITICQVVKVPVFDINKLSDTSIFPKIECISYEVNKRDFNDQIAKLVSLWEDGIFADFSIDAFDVWGPKNLIPKGYVHIKEGEIKNGDYYFESNTYPSSPIANWLSVDISYSSHRPNKKIEIRGVKYVGTHRYRNENEVIKYYYPFIIRKKIIKI